MVRCIQDTSLSLTPPISRLSSVSASGMVVEESSMERKDLVVLCKLSFGVETIATRALIDYGSTRIAFANRDCSHHQHLPLVPLKTLPTLKVFDGRPMESGDITNVTNTTLSIHIHHEEITVYYKTRPLHRCPQNTLNGPPQCRHPVQHPDPNLRLPIQYSQLQCGSYSCAWNHHRLAQTTYLRSRLKRSSGAFNKLKTASTQGPVLR